MDVDTLEKLSQDVEVNNAQPGSQTRRVGATGVGVQSIIDQGITDAVDVWGNVGAGTEVCLQGEGRIIFLDATTAPRAQVPLNGRQADGKTCASIPNAGTVVLLPPDGNPTPEPPDTQTELSSSVPEPTVTPDQTPTPLSDCTIQAQYNLNLRASPVDGAIIGLVPANTVLTSGELRAGYFLVVYNGVTGYVSGAHVSRQETCS